MSGNTQVFSSTTTVADRRAMPYTMPEKGNIQSICIYHEGGTGNLLLAVYNDNGSGKPGTRLGVTESTSINGSAGWQTVELTSPVDVAEGQTIWLAWVFSNNPGIRYTTGSPGRAASGVGWSGGMPGSFGSSTTSSYIYSIYANYTSTGLVGNPYMFTGRRFDIETGLYYYRARYYNPHIGRFMQTDPVGYSAGINWYLYCGNNPLAFVDPSGLLRYRDPDESLTGMIYDTTTSNWWGLVGEWAIDDIRAWYYYEPEEVLSHEVVGITVYVILDLGMTTLNPPERRTDGGEIVYLEEGEGVDILLAIALTVTEPEPTGDIIGEGRSWPRPDWWPWPGDFRPYFGDPRDPQWVRTFSKPFEILLGLVIPSHKGSTTGTGVDTLGLSTGGWDNDTMEGAAYMRTMEAAQQYDRWATFWRWWLFEF